MQSIKDLTIRQIKHVVVVVQNEGFKVSNLWYEITIFYAGNTAVMDYSIDFCLVSH